MSEKEGKSTAAKWLTGCGIGCGVIVLLCIAAAAVVYYAVKDTVNAFQDLEESRKILTERYGSAHDYCPKATAAIPAERMEAFLKIREDMMPTVGEMQKSYDAIAKEVEKANKEGEEEGGFWEAMSIIKTGFSIPSLLGKFYGTRNRKMVEVDMSPGEYLYIYSLAYYSYLGHKPEDGLDFSKFERKHKNGKFEFSVGESDESRRRQKEWNDEEVKKIRRRNIRHRLRGFLIPMMKCQLNKIKELQEGEEPDNWTKALETEINTLEKDMDRIPWEDGLPEDLEDSFQPYKDRLNATYSNIVNMMELDFQ